MKYIVNSELEMKEVATKFASTLKLGDVVLLNGDLGAGKTTFTRYVLTSLGVNEIINSPTFSILKTYHSKYTFHHFDTYRIGVDEAIEAGFDEVLDDRDSIIFIEWSENISSLLPKKCIVINIRLLDEYKREIEIIR